MKASIMLVTSQITNSPPKVDSVVSPLSWSNVKEMSDSGIIEFGSHSNNLHNPKTKGLFVSGYGHSNGVQHFRGETKQNYQLRLDEDIKQSIQLISKYTEKEVCSFAYPFGVRDAWSIPVLKQSGIKVTFLTGNKTADISRGLYDLKRIQILDNTDISKIIHVM